MSTRAIRTVLLASLLGAGGCFVPVPYARPVYGPPAVVVERPVAPWWRAPSWQPRGYVIEHDRVDRPAYDRSHRYVSDDRRPHDWD
jgi:hypothetical protein